MSTFWVSPMAPSSTVPTRPARARAGVAGAVVPTPEGCHPVANWARVEDQLGKGTNWPTAGSLPLRTPLVPMTTTSAAASQVVSLTCPLTRPGPGSTTPAGAAGHGADGRRWRSRSAISSIAASSAAASSSAWAPWNPCWKTRRP